MDKSFEPIGSGNILSPPRQGSGEGNEVVNDQLLASGGYTKIGGVDGFTRKSELISLDGTSEITLDSPEFITNSGIVGAHCIIKVNETTIFITGGNTKRKFKFALLIL